MTLNFVNKLKNEAGIRTCDRRPHRPRGPGVPANQEFRVSSSSAKAEL